MSDKLELMLEAERRGILPEDKTELLAEARRRGLVPGGEKPVYGSKEDVKAEAARRQEKQPLGYTNAIVGDALTLGAAPKIFGGAKGLTNYAVKKFKGEETDLSTEYARERDIYRAQEKSEEDQAGGVKSVAGGIAAGLVVGPARAAAGATAEAAAPVVGGIRNFLVDKAKAAGYGGVFGGIYGFNKSDEDLATKAESAKDHAIAGAILAPVVKTGLDAVGAYRGYRADKKQARADVANERAQVFEAADARPFTPALNDNASLAARAIEGNIAAEPLRRSARMTLDDLEKGLERHFKGSSEGMTPSETGDRLRMFLREQLLGENGNSTMIKAQTPEELATLSGVQPLKPPKVEPTKPERVPPISQDEYLRGVEAGVPEVQPRQTTSTRTIHPDSPENLSLEQFREASRKGMIGPADNPAEFEALTGRPFERIPRDQVQADRNAGPLTHIDQGLNLGYRTEDIAAHAAHSHALRTDPNYHAQVLAYQQDRALRSWGPDWRSKLTPEKVAEFDRAIPGTPQGSRLQAQLETFDFNSPPKVRPVPSDEHIAGAYAEITNTARQKGSYSAPKIEDVPLSDDLLKNLQKSNAEHADARRRYEANQKLVEEHEAPLKQRGVEQNLGQIEWNPAAKLFAVDVPGEGRIWADWQGMVRTVDGNPAIATAERQQLIKDSVDFMTNHPVSEIRTRQQDLRREMERLDLRRQALEKEAHAYRTEMQPVIAEQRRAQALKDAQEMAQSEAALATQKAREEAVERARPQAQADALKATQKAQAEENARAAAETALRQAQATAEHSRNVGKPFELGDSPLPVKSQLDAAYEQVRRNAPAMQPNLLGDRATKTKPEMRTNTTKLIDDIAIEARRRNEMPGYRDGEIFEPGDVGVQPRIMDYLRERLGDNIVGRLEEYAAKRSSNQLPPNIRGLVDLRSDLRRMSRDSYTGAPGEPRKPDTAMMTRMADSVDKDIRAFARAQGEQGAAWVRQLDQVDAQYSRYLNDMRAPLSKILDEKTDSAGIYQKLVSSMREGTTSVDTLRRVYDLVDLKGSEKLNRANLTGALLADMGRDGLPGFLKAWSKLSPDAKAIMFQGNTEALGSKLEAVYKAGNLMESHMGVAANGELSPTQLMRTSNVLLGTLAYAHAPAAITSALGINVASRILSSKWYAGWLRSAPVKSIGGPEWTRHMDRMVGYAGEMTGNNPEAVRALRETIGIKDANALFLGEKSETANKDALEEAKALEKKRTNPKDIYHKTGWFKGRDNVWRYEIDDKPTKLTSEANAYFKHVHKKLGDIDTTLGTLIKHDELFKAFPDAKNIKVRLMRTKQANEAADMGDNELAHTWGALWDSPTKTMIVNAQAILSREDLRSVLLHETQHYLQDVNGFDYGPLSGNYERRYGEVEAYNVQKREPMDAEQRRRSYPPSTQGVSMKDILLSRRRETARGPQ